MKTVIEMAREAGFNLKQGFLLRVTGIDEDLERFAELVRADERAKIAEQPAQQEPVNQRAHEIALRQWESWKTYALELQEKLVKYEGGTTMVLNTSPPTQRTWVGLTERDLDELACGGLFPDRQKVAQAIEAKLKEKNSA